MGPTTLVETLADWREQLTPFIDEVKTEADKRPLSGAEITLALRKVQEARMWLGVAEAMERGLDPWANRIEVKD